MSIEVTAKAQSGEIRATARYPEGKFLKQVAGAKWDGAGKAWKIPATIANAMSLRLAVKERGYTLLGDSAMADLIRAAKKQATAAVEVKASGTLDQPARRVYDAWRHQLEAYNFAAGVDSAMLNMEMGTGKTKVVIDLIQNDPSVKVAVVLCPTSVVGVWQREIEKHGSRKVGWNVPVLKGSVAKRAEQVSKAVAAAPAGSTTVLILNYEAAWREPMAKVLKDLRPDMTVFDEIHKIKSAGGRASRYCQQLGAASAKRLGLTGTMMPRSPLDVYGQFRALNPGVFGTSNARFKARYAVMGGYMRYEVVGYQNEQELRDKIQFMTYEVGADVLDLPEATHVYRECDWQNPKARKAYRDLLSQFYTEVDEGTVTAGNALVKLLRLRQLTGGYLHTDDSETEPVQVDTAKQKLLLDTLEDFGDEPAVVFCQFTKDIEAVKEAGKKLGKTVLELSGRVKQNFEFQAGEGDILAVQIQAGGVGIDLTRARYCVYYSIGFNMGEYLQSLARVHRPGQDRPVTYVHLIMRGTVDQQVYNALEARANLVEAVMHGDRG
jgi:SNF2 family DNA or RNA helicase